MAQKNAIIEKLREAAASVLPITGIVFVLCLFLVPMDAGLLLSFLIGSAMLILGMGLFTMGADMSMTRIGNHVGAAMTRSKKLIIILPLSFLLGAAVTVAEPDLQVLAANVPQIKSSVLVFAVSAGVGLFLMLCMVRIIFSLSLRTMLIVFYGVLFALCIFIEPEGVPVAFDSGGVTTGPMTVPFIMALGVGVSSIRSDENAKADSFGLVALCSIGPVLSVMLLNAVYGVGTSSSVAVEAAAVSDTVELGFGYLKALPEYFKEVSVALLPIFVIFLLFQLVSLRLRKLPLLRIVVGIVYTYLGLVLFLTGVNVGFSPLGYMLGGAMAQGALLYALVPLSMLMGWFIINAEPAVHVLTKQVEKLSAGAISEKAMGLSLSIAVACSCGLSMLRILLKIRLMYFILPGYLLALGLSFFVPKTFTAIAFDSGGVASGPLTAAFMLPFAIGVCAAVGGNVMTDAFGLVALVAMTPLITVQVMGLISVLRAGRESHTVQLLPYDEDAIIELWEVQ